jgi:hypothetical protein
MDHIINVNFKLKITNSLIILNKDSHQGRREGVKGVTVSWGPADKMGPGWGSTIMEIKEK